jgi:chitinase
MNRKFILIVLLILVSALSVCADEEVVPQPYEEETPSTSPVQTAPYPTDSREMPDEGPSSSTGPIIPPTIETQETPIIDSSAEDIRVVGYITHWKFESLPGIRLEELTHLIWQGVEVTSGTDPTLRVSGSADWQQIPEAVAAAHGAGIKAMVSLIGHWNQTDLNKIWKSSKLREKLIENLIDMVETYNLDGIDLDNEGTCDPATYSLFIKELYEAIAPLGKMISLAGSPYGACIEKGASRYLDFINLMTYDMGKGKGYPYHSTLEESVQALDLWADNGIPKEKLLMGIPFYGRDAHVNAFEYQWIVEKYNPNPDQNEMSEPTAVGGKIWWNGIDLVKQKVQYVIENGFGGVMVYEVGIDSPGNFSLLEAIFEELG